MAHIAAFNAADHGVGLAAHHPKCCDHGSIGANHGASRVGRNAMPAGDVDIGLHIGAVARVVLGIDEIEVLAGLDREPKSFDPRFDHRRASDQYRPGQLLLEHDLGRVQHALVLTLGIDQSDRLRLGFRKQRFHDQARAEREPLQLRGVVLKFVDRTAGNARLHCRLRHRGRDAQDQPGIERARNQRAGTKALRLSAIEGMGPGVYRRIARQLRDRLDRGLFHFFVDRGSTDIERAAKDEWKAQDIVDLVWKIGAPGADHRIRTRFAGLVRHDFRIRIGQRHYQRLVRHLLHHVGRQHIGC